MTADRIARMMIGWPAVAIGWAAGLLVFGLISVRYGYWRGLGLTDEEIGGRVLAREQARVKAPPEQQKQGPQGG